MRYFLARYNRYYAFIMQRDIRVLYGVIILLQLCLLSVWLYVWYMPTHTYIIHQEQLLSRDYTTLYVTYKKRVDSLNQYIVALEKKYYEDMYALSQPDVIMRRLCDVTHALDIKMDQCLLSHFKNKNNSIIYRVQLDLAASLSQLISFFERCITHQLPIRCVRCDGTYATDSVTRLVLQWYCIENKKALQL